MSRLESFIRRMEAQRACIDFAARAGNTPQGPIFELGLGNGRTYDHLRERFPGRDIFVFERNVNAHAASMPDAEHLIVGDIDGVLVVPRDSEVDVITRALQKARTESVVRKALLEGMKASDAFAQYGVL